MLVRPDLALEEALKASIGAGFPPINVSAPQGMFLHILAKSVGARKILEIGTLGGYSTIWLGRALPRGGRLTTLELDPEHARIAKKNISRAGLSRKVELRLGKALDSMPKLLSERVGPFDLIFIDADKPSIPEYFLSALKLSRRGTIIIVDNVVRGGAVIDARSRDENVRGVRRFNEVVAGEKRVLATTIQTVGAKGYDGFSIVLVVAD